MAGRPPAAPGAVRRAVTRRGGGNQQPGFVGRAAGAGLLGRLVSRAAGRTAGAGLLSGLVSCAAGRTAGRCGAGLDRFAPSEQVGKCHFMSSLGFLSGGFVPRLQVYCSTGFGGKKVRTILLLSHLAVTMEADAGRWETGKGGLDGKCILDYNQSVTFNLKLPF